MNQAGTVTAWIGLGANLGDTRAALRHAVQALNALEGTRVQRVSSLYRSAPVGADGPDYLNAVAEVATRLPPLPLLCALQAMEHAAGRQRPWRNAPRTLDMDILLYDHEQLDSPELTIPHPRITERAFVLLPLAELAPWHVSRAWLDAVQGQRIERLDRKWLPESLI